MTLAEHMEQKGRQIGLQEGLQAGLQEGGSKREIEIARNMLALGLDSILIERATGLGSKELDALTARSPENNG